MIRPNILIVQQETQERKVLEWLLRDEFDITTASNTTLALPTIRLQEPRFVFLDLDVCEYLHECGADQTQKFRCFLCEVRERAPHAHVIIAGNDLDSRCIGEVLRKGAHDFLLKPVDVNLLRCLIWRACARGIQNFRQADSERELPALDGKMIGTDKSIRQMFDLILKVAATEIPVLITGESGTGKELAARAVHARSFRKHGPFVPINCAAIPENLLEAELFGYERGAFTGASRQKVGKIEYAKGGTLFLDEVGELPLGLQVKLLRFLDDHMIERVGGRWPIKVDARVVAATNVNLEEAILKRKFRDDLYYRLAAAAIKLPPLRERGEDAVVMATHFLSQATGQSEKKLFGFTPEAIEAIKDYHWPGNVRELLNKVSLAAVLSEGCHVTPKDLNLPHPGTELPAPAPLKEARRQFGEEILVRALARHNGDLKEVARELKVSRSMVYYLLNKHGIRPRIRSVQ